MKAFLTGLGIGVGLGVLFAPDSGEATRKKMGERLSDWSEWLSRQDENLKTTTRGMADRVSDTAANASGKASDLPPKKSADRESASSESDLLERGILPQSTFDELERELDRHGKRSA
jgi:gas vesicle protein